MVDLPYIGLVSLEVLLFIGSAAAFRMYMFWRDRRCDNGYDNHDNDNDNDEESNLKSGGKIVGGRTEGSPRQQWNRGNITRMDSSFRSSNLRSTKTPDAKATLLNATNYRDKGLYQTIKECQERKHLLRKVKDPDNARKEKMMKLRQNGLSKGGYLGLSSQQLQYHRSSLRNVVGDNPSDQV
eukprot:CAMPEP_0202478642 /NCGR_PEP_ID=MMETSP1360-20130828/94565_1 /ASSEMBLY_ACC=CAM_ASM_000848 /TAXON_ID=515479 /ORGANISM="Licmophora paradoxa, Strain CCMP2313" /LENGTH=181 /DNA_ID=CAMNT_0049105927 /DNA_START=457 /DNA_END=1002 /DNA_ORIENTATION=-